MEESDELDSFGKRLRWARLKSGRFEKSRDAAEYFGLAPTTYNEHETDRRTPRRDKAKRYADTYGVRVDWLFDGAGVPAQAHQSVKIIGEIIAGSQLSFYQDDRKKTDVAAPIDATLVTVAVEVRGGIMRGIADDGWLIFFDDLRQPPDKKLLGKLCVTLLDDGRILVRTLQLGKKKGRYDLESPTEATMRDCKVVWAAQVTWIKPR